MAHGPYHGPWPIVSTSMPQSTIFLWTLLPTCLSSLIYFILSLKCVFSKDFFGDMKLPIRIFIQVIIIGFSAFLPISMILLLTFFMYKSESYKENPSVTKTIKVISKWASKVHVSSIFTQASLQCFIQCHIMMPILIDTDWSNIVWASTVIWFYKSQIISILTSLGLVAYYFTINNFHYYKMSTACKAVYALHIILASLGKLLIINLFAFTAGHFFLALIMIMIHLFLVVAVHCAVDHKISQDYRKSLFSATFFLKAMTNPFTYHPEKEVLKNEIIKHGLLELASLILYLVMWIFLMVSLESEHVIILGCIWGFYWSSVLLKIAFYFVLHPESTSICQHAQSKQQLFLDEF